MECEEFFNRVKFESNGCWRWIGSVDTGGYGQFYYPSNIKNVAHRFVVLVMKGELKKDFQIDHLCHNRWCVNPFHLEEVTQQKNISRSILGPKMTHCFNGHEFTEENTVYDSKGYARRCRICKTKYEAERERLYPRRLR